ncbi:MAG: GNAT family N-acetyltransferase [Candidatus Woesearchaeota archaeon]
MKKVLDYLGQPTKDGHVFRQGSVDGLANDLLRLSKNVYNDTLYNCVITEMDLTDCEGNPLPKRVIDLVRRGDVHLRDEFYIRSREFEDKVGNSVVMCYDSNDEIVGVRVHAKPTDGYHYKAGKDKNGDSELEIHGEWSNQAHCWEMAFLESVRRKGFGTFAYLAAVRLSEQEGAEHITTYTSIESDDLASTKFAEKMQELVGLKYIAKFPMLDENNEHVNNGRLWMLPLKEPRVQEGLNGLEHKVIERLF